MTDDFEFESLGRRQISTFLIKSKFHLYLLTVNHFSNNYLIALPNIYDNYKIDEKIFFQNFETL